MNAEVIARLGRACEEALEGEAIALAHGNLEQAASMADTAEVCSWLAFREAAR